MYDGLREKLDKVCEQLTQNWGKYHARYYPNSYAISGGPRAVMVWGRRYVNVDRNDGVQQSGVFMVDQETGLIYGIKAYGKVNKNHNYGLVDKFLEKYGNGIAKNCHAHG